MTPAETRALILGMRDAIAKTEASLLHHGERQAEDRAMARTVENRLADIQTRLRVLERDSEGRSKREAESRGLKTALWIAVVSAILSVAATLVTAYLTRNRP